MEGGQLIIGALNLLSSNSHFYFGEMALKKEIQINRISFFVMNKKFIPRTLSSKNKDCNF